MIRLVCFLWLAVSTAMAEQVAFNFSADLKGDPDYRPGTWGRAGYVTWTVTFTRPVRVLRAFGDLVAWPKGTVERGKFAGVLLGLQTMGPEGSRHCDLCADNTLLYLQMGVADRPERAGFDHAIANGLLPDGRLVIKVAVWLNETEREIHIEPTINLVFEFVDR